MRTSRSTRASEGLRAAEAKGNSTSSAQVRRKAAAVVAPTQAPATVWATVW